MQLIMSWYKCYRHRCSRMFNSPPLLLLRPAQPIHQNDNDQRLNEVRFCQTCAGRLPIIHQSVCGVPAALCIDTNAHRDRPRLQNRVIWLWKHIKQQGARSTGKKTKGETLTATVKGKARNEELLDTKKIYFSSGWKKKKQLGSWEKTR